METNPYQSPASTESQSQSEVATKSKLPQKFAFWLFMIPTLLSGICLLRAHMVGIEAGVGDEGMDSPGWSYLQWIPIIDFPAAIVVSLLSGPAWLGDAFIELENTQRIFVISRFTWPVIGYLFGAFVARQSQVGDSNR
jgi:hypothetical protein